MKTIKKLVCETKLLVINNCGDGCNFFSCSIQAGPDAVCGDGTCHLHKRIVDTFDKKTMLFPIPEWCKVERMDEYIHR